MFPAFHHPVQWSKDMATQMKLRTSPQNDLRSFVSIHFRFKISAIRKLITKSHSDFLRLAFRERLTRMWKHSTITFHCFESIFRQLSFNSFQSGKFFIAVQNNRNENHVELQQEDTFSLVVMLYLARKRERSLVSRAENFLSLRKTWMVNFGGIDVLLVILPRCDIIIISCSTWRIMCHVST